MNRSTIPRRNGRPNQPSRVRSSISHPPQFSATRRTIGRARYVSASAVTADILRLCLLNHLIVNGASGTTNYRLFSAIRLKSVDMWCSTATLGAITTASIEWESEQGPTVIHSDSSVGTAEPLHVHSKPPAKSIASFWSLTGVDESTALFRIVCPTNTIVDITFEAVFQDGETPVAVTTTASGVAGTVYMSYLQGATTTTLVPVSYPSLT